MKIILAAILMLSAFCAGAQTTVDIVGGTIDGTVIGGTAPSQGAFTEVTIGAAGTTGTLYVSSENNLTALAGGGNAGTPLAHAIVSRITTVASPGDSVRLPHCLQGIAKFVRNDGANAMQVYGVTAGVTINGQVSISQNPGAGMWYFCIAPFQYITN